MLANVLISRHAVRSFQALNNNGRSREQGTMPRAPLRSTWLATTLLLAACSSSGSVSRASREAGRSPPEYPLPPPADAAPDIAQSADSFPDRSARAEASRPDSGTSGLDAG